WVNHSGLARRKSRTDDYGDGTPRNGGVAEAMEIHAAGASSKPRGSAPPTRDARCATAAVRSDRHHDRRALARCRAARSRLHAAKKVHRRINAGLPAKTGPRTGFDVGTQDRRLDRRRKVLSAHLRPAGME